MKVVFVSGRFNVLHPGHVRLLQFARSCGDRLVVGVESDEISGFNAHVSETLRLEGVRSCALVDDCFLIKDSVVQTILRLKPDVVVKGREFEFRFNPEKQALDSYSGQLVFSSGEVVFTSSDLLRKEFLAPRLTSLRLPVEFMERHGIAVSDLRELVSRLAGLKVLVVGDLIVDEYVSCDPLGMSQEDPTIVVKPVDSKRFVGGAGIVAAHAAGLGACATLLSICGLDGEADFSRQVLDRQGVSVKLIEDATRPTTLKTRFRCQGKTLLRVSRLHQAPISAALADRLLFEAQSLMEKCDILVFSDFNYGVLSDDVIMRFSRVCAGRSIFVAADSQSSSQVGDVLRFRNVNLLTPTEREARLALRNSVDGLSVLGQRIRDAAGAQHVILKLGGDGALICTDSAGRSSWSPDQIEALNKSPKDVAGAGDSMLIASSMALAVGGTIWEAACIGSIAAAIQVGRVGNFPIAISELDSALNFDGI